MKKLTNNEKITYMHLGMKYVECFMKACDKNMDKNWMLYIGLHVKHSNKYMVLMDMMNEIMFQK